MADNPTAADFSFNALGLGSVLKLNRLNVPLYQREYSWSEDIVDQLLTDLARAKSEEQSYFLGTVVTIPNAQSNDKLEVVDGQQRLTTTAILLAAVRDYLKENGLSQMVVESIENEFLSTIDRKREERVPRLELNIDDRNFFSALMSPDGEVPETSRESHRRLLRAKEKADQFVRGLVATYDEDARVSVLNDWLEFIENRATVILLKAPDSAHAFRMFETLNDRGLKTSQADLVKNYLFGEAGDRITEAQARWSGMLTVLEEIDDDDRSVNFLRHGLIATRAFTRADKVYGTVQRSVRGQTNSLQFLSDLERLATVYVATFHPDSDYWSGYSEQARRALKTLKLLDVKPFRPLLLSIGERFTPVEGAKAFRLLVSIGVRSLVSGRIHSGQMDDVTSQAALSVYREEISNLADLRTALAPICLPDDEFKEKFETLSVSKHVLARYYLRALEMTGLDDEAEMLPNEDAQDVTLEHILPKKPRDGEWDTFMDDQVRSYSRRLGNLCLMKRTANSNAGSDTFAEKKPLYKESDFHLTNGLGNFDEWTPETITGRQSKLAEIAVKTWPV